jgi:hypothetical protein
MQCSLGNHSFIDKAENNPDVSCVMAFAEKLLEILCLFPLKVDTVKS